MSIGWVMFWKAIVLAVIATAGGLWQGYKAKRRAEGIPLRYDTRRRVYIPDNKLERFELWARRVFYVAAGAFFLFSLLVAGLIVFV